FRRDRVAVDRDQRIRRLPPQDLLAHLFAQLDQRLADRLVDQVPVGLLGVAFEFVAHLPDAVANPRGLGAQRPGGNHPFHVAQPIRPVAEVLSRQRPGRLWLGAARGAAALIGESTEVARTIFASGAGTAAARVCLLLTKPATTPLSAGSCLSTLAG